MRGRIYVRATVSLSGFRAGTIRPVDADHPRVAALIANGWLVPVEEKTP